MKHSPSRHSQTQNEEMQYKKGYELIQHDYEQGKPSVEFIVQILLESTKGVKLLNSCAIVLFLFFWKTKVAWAERSVRGGLEKRIESATWWMRATKMHNQISLAAMSPGQYWRKAAIREDSLW